MSIAMKYEMCSSQFPGVMFKGGAAGRAEGVSGGFNCEFVKKDLTSRIRWYGGIHTHANWDLNSKFRAVVVRLLWKDCPQHHTYGRNSTLEELIRYLTVYSRVHVT